VAAGTGKSSTHPTQRHTTCPGHPRTGHTIQINDPRSTGLAEALRRDAAALLDAYRAGTWVPAPEEHEFAEDLARGHWDPLYFRTALREVPPAVRSGRLVDVLAPAAEVFDQTNAAVDEDVVVQLRALVDALTACPCIETERA
jgi:hypothetical protein